jgi:T-complex protein 1 subunit zeta
LDGFRIVKETVEKPLLISVARTALCTKLHPELANQLVDIVVDAVNIIKIPDKPIDLHMI